MRIMGTKQGLRRISAVLTVLLVMGVAGMAADKAMPENVPFEEGKNPPAPVPGRAWCIITEPAQYKQETDTVEIAPATFYMEQIPAEYEERDEKVMVAPEKKVPVYVPATWKTVEEKVLVQEAYERIEVVPAQWEWVETEVQVQDGYNDVAATPAQFKTVKETIELAPDRLTTARTKCVDGYDCYATVECPPSPATRPCS